MSEKTPSSRTDDTPPPERFGIFQRLGFTLTAERIIRIAVAIGLISLSILTDRQYLAWGLIASVLVLFLPRNRGRYFLAGIVPYASAWFVFSFLRSMADETLFAKTLNTEVVHFERWIFNGEIPTIKLQATFYTPGRIEPWDYYFTFIHWSYFIVPHIVALWIWWRNKAQFQRYLAALTLTLLSGLVIYFLIPSNPPWMAPEAIDSPIAPTVQRIMEPIAMSLGGGLYQAGYKIVGESNPIAAMPSLHFAVTFLMVCITRGRGKRVEALAWIYALSMGMALVYMGEHYVIDVLVGALITTYSWLVAGFWVGKHYDDPKQAVSVT